MKTALLAATMAATTLASCATQVPENSKAYTCREYNAMREKVAANPAEAYRQPDTLRFAKVNMVGFRTALSKHPSREEAMRIIDDSVDIQALQCRTAPDAIVHYTAEQTAPGSVRLGYMVEYPSGKPVAVKEAEFNFKMGKPVADEKGMGPVKALATNCAAKSAPASACRLGNL